ncbi:hypothetical protein GYMLUDRAFT_240407 [Collybiopsis luxurians FD-317 M1]|nr:hypothetical protein GYMLUDRAFT_240407 [Collybiopsis luxurians FD-317 M1]
MGFGSSSQSFELGLVIGLTSPFAASSLITARNPARREPPGPSTKTLQASVITRYHTPRFFSQRRTSTFSSPDPDARSSNLFRHPSVRSPSSQSLPRPLGKDLTAHLYVPLVQRHDSEVVPFPISILLEIFRHKVVVNLACGGSLCLMANEAVESIYKSNSLVPPCLLPYNELVSKKWGGVRQKISRKGTREEGRKEVGGIGNARRKITIVGAEEAR